MKIVQKEEENILCKRKMKILEYCGILMKCFIAYEKGTYVIFYWDYSPCFCDESL